MSERANESEGGDENKTGTWNGALDGIVNVNVNDNNNDNDDDSDNGSDNNNGNDDNDNEEYVSLDTILKSQNQVNEEVLNKYEVDDMENILRLSSGVADVCDNNSGDDEDEKCSYTELDHKLDEKGKNCGKNEDKEKEKKMEKESKENGHKGEFKENNVNLDKDDKKIKENIDNGLQNENGINLYQIQGIKNKSGAILKHIGQAKERPTIIINTFEIRNYVCNIISYLLSDVDIQQREQTQQTDDSTKLKILGLIVQKNGKVCISISFIFNTNIHRIENKTLSEYISKSNDILIDGFYEFELRYINKDKKNVVEKIGNTYKTYPGKNKSVSHLIDLLSHDYVMGLYL